MAKKAINPATTKKPRRTTARAAIKDKPKTETGRPARKEKTGKFHPAGDVGYSLNDGPARKYTSGAQTATFNNDDFAPFNFEFTDIDNDAVRAAAGPVHSEAPVAQQSAVDGLGLTEPLPEDLVILYRERIKVLEADNDNLASLVSSQRLQLTLAATEATQQKSASLNLQSVLDGRNREVEQFYQTALQTAENNLEAANQGIRDLEKSCGTAELKSNLYCGLLRSFQELDRNYLSETWEDSTADWKGIDFYVFGWWVSVRKTPDGWLWKSGRRHVPNKLPE